MKSRTRKMWQRFGRTGNEPTFMKRRTRKYARERSGGLYERVERVLGCGHKHIGYSRIESGKGLIHNGRKP